MFKFFLLTFFLATTALACPQIEGQFHCKEKSGQRYDVQWRVSYDPVGPTYIINSGFYVWTLVADGVVRDESNYYDTKSVVSCSGPNEIVWDTVYSLSSKPMGNGKKTFLLNPDGSLTVEVRDVGARGNLYQESWTCTKS